MPITTGIGTIKKILKAILVKEIFRLDGDVSSFVTKGVLEKLNEKR